MYKYVTLEVIGDQKLVCEGCQERVEHAVKTMEGVQQVRARASNQRIEVLFDAAKMNGDAIAERIAKTGYHTKVVAPPSDSAK